jgi:hypothetical protein
MYATKKAPPGGSLLCDMLIAGTHSKMQHAILFHVDDDAKQLRSTGTR